MPSFKDKIAKLKGERNLGTRQRFLLTKLQTGKNAYGKTLTTSYTFIGLVREYTILKYQRNTTLTGRKPQTGAILEVVQSLERYFRKFLYGFFNVNLDQKGRVGRRETCQGKENQEEICQD
jgi:hypothetical protein